MLLKRKMMNIFYINLDFMFANYGLVNRRKLLRLYQNLFYQGYNIKLKPEHNFCNDIFCFSDN